MLNNSPATSDSDSDSFMESSLLTSPVTSLGPLSTSRDVVLHPYHSYYSRAHPEYNVFSQTVLVDNGYVNAGWDMDTSDNASSSGSDISQACSISTCSSLNTHLPDDQATRTPFPILIDDTFTTNDDTMVQFTATDVASNSTFSTFRSDIIDT